MAKADTFFLKSRRKPDATKGFLENIQDHLHYLTKNILEEKTQLKPQEVANLWNLEFSKLTNATLKQLMDSLKQQLFLTEHFSIFKPLYDRYDYFDEILGASAVPVLSFTTAILSFGMAIWEGINIFIKDSSHAERAGSYLLAAGIFSVTGIFSLVKSFVALFTRPIVTAICGWNTQDDPRFYNDNNAEISNKM